MRYPLMPGAYGWLVAKNPDVDFLIRDGLRVGEIQQRGKSWVSAVRRPLKRNLELVDHDTPPVVKKATSREEARALTLQTAQSLWGDSMIPEDLSEMAAI